MMFMTDLYRRIFSVGLASSFLLGCAPGGNDTMAPPPPPSTAPAQVAVTAKDLPKATTTPETKTAPAAPIDPNLLSTADPAKFSKKDIENIIERLNWFAENYISQKNRIPTLDELKAWKDPNFPLGLPEWPTPPPGKKWVMSEKSGQFSLADEKP